MRRLLDGKTMDQAAIDRLRYFEKETLAASPDGYWLAFSGGKDSIVILDLAERAGVKFTAHYSITTVDPPELVQFVKTFPQVQRHRPPESMWQLIRRKGMPPLRRTRYCCEKLKERYGAGHIIITGIRWAESSRRSRRQMVEACYRDKTKRFLNIIINWSTADVWEYIRERHLRYCSLYDEGFKRLGCILCPMSEQVQRDIDRWPRIAAAWEKAVKATFKPGRHEYIFKTPDEYWQWWLDRQSSGFAPDAPVLFDDEGVQHE